MNSEGLVTAQIFGELNAQRFLLENLFSLALSADPNPVAAATAARDEFCRQFEMVYENTLTEEEQVVAQHGLHSLEAFWRGVIARLKTA